MYIFRILAVVRQITVAGFNAMAVRLQHLYYGECLVRRVYVFVGCSCLCGSASRLLLLLPAAGSGP